MIAQTEWEIIDHLTTTYRSLYLYRASSGYWSATLMVDDDRPASDGIAYTDDREGHVVLDGSSLHVVTYAATRAEVLGATVSLLAAADDLLAALPSPEGEVVS